jgi:hypothetical protein
MIPLHYLHHIRLLHLHLDPGLERRALSLGERVEKLKLEPRKGTHNG